MKFLDCVWELENLGECVCEIIIEQDDLYDEKRIEEYAKDFDYVVIKVPVNMPGFNIGLSNQGYSMIETQINISKKYKEFDFNDRLVKYMIKHVDEKTIATEKELEELLKEITPNMFSTDRIYLDPHFSREASMRRYINWIKTEFSNKTAIITQTYFDGKEVGFGMCRDFEGCRTGLLGGVYESVQAEGLGILTGCIGFLIGKKYNRPFTALKTSISSNNIPMLQIYNYLHFKIDKMTYVFVKHNNEKK